MKIAPVGKFAFLNFILVAASVITTIIAPGRGRSESKANAFRNDGLPGFLVSSLNTPAQLTCKPVGRGACWNTFSRLNNNQSGTSVIGFDLTSNGTTYGDIS